MKEGLLFQLILRFQLLSQEMSISFELNKPSTIDSESRISKEVLPLPAKPSSGKSRLVYYILYIYIFEYNFKYSSIHLHLKHRLMPLIYI